MVQLHFEELRMSYSIIILLLLFCLLYKAKQAESDECEHWKLSIEQPQTSYTGRRKDWNWWPVVKCCGIISLHSILFLLMLLLHHFFITSYLVSLLIFRHCLPTSMEVGYIAHYFFKKLTVRDVLNGISCVLTFFLSFFFFWGGAFLLYVSILFL